jgi:hypothetical protein
MQLLTAERGLRYNRLLDKLGMKEFVLRVPPDFGADEYNVFLSMGVATLGAGATTTLSTNAPRDLILRQLVIQEQTLSPTAAGINDWRVTGITIEGNTVALGSIGGIPGIVFSALSLVRPEFNLPLAGGTPVSVSLVNDSAAGQELAVVWYID